MISYIKGELTEKMEGIIVVENNGVGFNINVPQTIFEQLPSIGEQVKVYTYLQIREDAHVLYGFLDRETLEIFKLLINVNSVGPKVALSILSTLSYSELVVAVANEDEKLISSAKGVGAKCAKKVILELKEKVNMMEVFAAEVAAGNGGASANGIKADNSFKNEAVEALVALGYSQSEAVNAVKKIEDIDNKDTETILKEALKNMAFI